MAVTMHLPSSRSATPATRTAVATRETAWRLAAAAIMSLAATAFTIGTAWDIQWHAAVGRDRALTSPHLLMLGGIGFAGLVSLALILIDTWRARRGAGVDGSNSSRLLRFFQAPIGLAVSGFGALLAVIAFPLDDYWHSLYGIDVTLWAPFHVMLGFGVVMVEFGALYLLASEINRMAPGRGQLGTEIGFLAALAVTMSTIMIFMVQGDFKEGLAHLGSYEFLLYPWLLALMAPIGLVTGVLYTRRPGAATAVALVFVGLRQVMYAFVPWAMDKAVTAQGLEYRPHAPQFPLMPFAFPVGIIVAALAIDAVAWLVRTRGSQVWTWAVAAGGALSVILLTFWEQPWAALLPKLFYLDMDPNAVFLRTLPLTITGGLVGVLLAGLISRGLAGTRQ